MSNAEVANLLAKLFISRPDVKAIQFPDGRWSPHERRNGRGEVVERYPWSRDDLNAHLAKTKTFGHYMLGTNDTVKLFAFDIDLEKSDPTKNVKFFHPARIDGDNWGGGPVEFNPREAWADRRHPARSFLKYQLKMTAHSLLKVISEELELPCAAAYSGGKGMHVYAFTGPMPASEAREGAKICLDTLGCWAPSRGDNFFKHADQDFLTGYPALSIEVFPKQDSLQGKDLGNLMRLPLGRNLKSSDPTFFVNMTTAMAEMSPIDPVWAMTEGAKSPWSTR